MKKFGKKSWLLMLATLISCFVLFAGFGCGYVYESTTYTVTFMNGDDVFSSKEYSYGDNAEFPEEEPEKEADDENSYTFVGWNYTGDPSEELVTAYQVQESVTFHAVYMAEKIGGEQTEYLVTFRDSVTGMLIPEASQYVREGGTAKYPAIPDHTDEHWTPAEQPWSEPEGTIITSRMEIVALYTRTVYPVYAHYLDKVAEVGAFAYGSNIRLSDGVPNLDPAFRFEGWYEDAGYSELLGTPEVSEQNLTQETVDGKAVTGVFVYAKYGLNVGADNPRLRVQGILTYGGEAYAGVPNLTHPEGLEYSYRWTVTLDGEQMTSEEETFALRNAGSYLLTCEVTADYLDGSLTATKTFGWYGNGEEADEIVPVTVEKANLFVSVALSANSVIYGSGAPESVISFEGLKYDDEEELDVPITFTYTNEKQASYEWQWGAEEPAKLPVGSYTMQTKVGELRNYKVYSGENKTEFDPLAFSVTKKPLTVSFTVPDYTYGEGFAPVPAFEGFAYGESAAVLGEPVYTVDETERKIGDYLGAGSHRATVSGFASENYEVIFAGDVSFSVAKRGFNVTTTASGCTYGGTPVYGYSVEILGEGYEFDEERRDEELKVYVPEYAFTREGTAYTVGGSYFRAGNYTVRADLKGDSSNYELRETSSADFTVARKELTVGISLGDAFIYGDEIAPEVSYNGFAEGEDAKNITVPSRNLFTYKTEEGTTYNAVNGVYGVGSYTVQLNKNFSADNYDIKFENDASHSFTVSQKLLKVTVELASEELTYGEKPSPSGSEGLVRGIRYDGFIEGESISKLFPGNEPTITYLDAKNEEIPASGTFHAGKYTATAKIVLANYKVQLEERSFNVKPKDVTVTIKFTGTASDGTYVYGTVPAYTTEYNGFLTGEMASYTRTAYLVYTGQKEGHNYTHNELTANGGARKYIAVDEYAVTVAGLGEGLSYNDYNLKTVETLTLTVSPKPLTVTVSADGFTYGGKDTPSPRVTYNGFITGENEEVLGGDAVYTYKREGTAYSSDRFDAGNYTVAVSGLTSDNYAIVTREGNFTVSKRTANVTLTATGATYGEEPTYRYGQTNILERDIESFGFGYSLTFSRTSNNYNEYTEYTPANYTYYQAGNYRVTLTFIQNENYNDINVPQAVFTVARKALTIGVEGIEDSYTYGDTLAPKLTFEGFVEGESENNAFSLKPETPFSYYNERMGSVNGEKLAVGNYFIAATNGYSADNYQIGYAANTAFGVTKKALKVTVSAGNITYGEKPAPELAFDGFVYGEGATVLSGSPNYAYTGTTNTQGLLRAGSHDVSVSGYDSANYEITFVKGTFNVAKRALTVKVEVADLVYGDDPKPDVTYDGFISGESESNLEGALTYAYTGETSTSGHYRAGGHTLQLGGYTSDDYDITFGSASFNVTAREVTVTFAVPWTTYADDQKDFKWYTVSDNILENELTFTPSFTREKKPYTLGSDPYLPHGEYVLTLTYTPNPDYTVKEGGNLLSGTATKSFSIAKRSLTVSLTGSTPWADRKDWRGTPTLSDRRFTLNGKFVLSDAENATAQPYTENEIDKTFKWENQYTIEYNGKDVTENFDLQYSISFTLSNSRFHIDTPSESAFTYDRAEHKFPITATASGVEQDSIEIEYKTNKEGEYQKTVPSFINAGEYTVYYKVTAPNCDPDEGSFTVTGNKATLTVTQTDIAGKYDGNNQAVALENGKNVSGLVEGDTFTVTYATEEAGDYKAELPSIVNVKDSGDVWYKIDAGNNYQMAEGDDGHYAVEVSKVKLTLQNGATDAVSVTYDTNNHFRTITKSMIGGLVGDDSFEVKYGKSEGNYENDKLTLINVAESSTVYFKVTAGENYEEVTGSYTVTINKADYTVIVGNQTFTYNGKEQGNAITVKGVDGDGSFTQPKVTYDKSSNDAPQYKDYRDGGYTVSYTVEAGDNYKEKSGNYTITINKATLTLTDNQVKEKSYIGESFGESTFFTVAGAQGGESGDSLYTAEIAKDGKPTAEIKDAGDYTITLKANPNYTFEGEAKVIFKIAQATLTVTQGDITEEYKPEVNQAVALVKGVNVTGLFGDDAFTVTYATEEAGAYTSELPSKINVKDTGDVWYQIDAGSNYNVKTGSYHVTINKAQGTIDVSKVKGNVLTYNGAQQTVSLENLTGITRVGDGTLTVKEFSFTTVAEGNGHEITVTLSDGENYLGTTATVTLTVNRATPELTEIYENSNSYVYNKTPKVKEQDIRDAIIQSNVYDDAMITYEIKFKKEEGSAESSLDNIGEMIKAGKYTITVKVSGVNYNEATGTYSFTIAPAPLQFSGATSDEKKYDGEPLDKSTFLKDKISGTIYDGDEGVKFFIGEDSAKFEEIKNHGIYTITIVAEDNYQFDTVTYTYKIDQIQLTWKPEMPSLTYGSVSETLTDGVKLEDYLHVNGLAEKDKADGVTYQYEYTADWFGGDQSQWKEKLISADAKEYPISVVVSVKGDNYIGISDTITFTIDKATVAKPEPAQESFTYNGKNQQYFESYDSSHITVKNNERKEAGKQTVTVELNDSGNYKWEGVEETESESKSYECTFEINKAPLTLNRESEKETYKGSQFLNNDFFTVTNEVEGETGYTVTIKKNEAESQLKDAGEYTVTLTAGANYVFDGEEEKEAVTFTVTIEQRGLTLEDKTKEDGFPMTFDPSFRADVASGLDRFFTVGNAIETETAYELSITSTVHGYSEIHGADDYTITLKAMPNYTFSDGNSVEITFTIDKKVLDKPTVPSKSYGYTSETISFEPDHYDSKYMEISNNTGIKVGTYRVIVNLIDTESCVWSDGTVYSVGLQFTIVKGTAPIPPQTEIEIGDSIGMFLGIKLKDVDLNAYFPGYYWDWSKNPEDTSLISGTNRFIAYYNPDPVNYENGTVSVTVQFSTRKEKITVYASSDQAFEGNFGINEITVDATALTSFEAFGEKGRTFAAEEIEYIQNLIKVGAASGNEVNFSVGGTYLVKFAMTLVENDYYEIEESALLQAVFKLKSVQVGSALYTIEDALAKAGSGDTVVVKNHTSFASAEIAKIAGYSVGNGNYTVKSGVKLFLPYDGNTGEHATTTTTIQILGNEANEKKYMKLELALPEGIVLFNDGAITIGGTTTGGNGGNSTGAGQTSGDYAQIKMGKNAGIVSTGDIQAWGFIREETSDNGSFVTMDSGNLLMPFIVIEHRGGMKFSGMLPHLNKTGSPFNRLFLQNVTPTLTVNYGATVTGFANLYANSHDNQTAINLIGTTKSYLLHMQKGTYAVVKYDIPTKVTKLDVYGGFEFNSMALNVAGADISTEEVLFPISWYWQIELFPLTEGGSAFVDITKQGIKLLPGSSLKINKGVSVTASRIAVYDTFEDQEYAATAYQKDERGNTPAVLTVNGTLNVESFTINKTQVCGLGGVVQTEGDGAVLKVATASLDSYEISSGGEWLKTTYDLKLKMVKDGVVDSEFTVSPAGTYESENGGWKNADTATEYNINYEYVFVNDTAGGTKEIVNENPATYTLEGDVQLIGATLEGWVFLGWFSDVSCREEYRLDVVQCVWRSDVTVYGLFEQVNSFVFSYQTNDGNITIAQETILDSDLDGFDPAEEHFAEVGVYEDDPTKTTFFDGWYLDSGYQTPYSAELVRAQVGMGINKPVTLYAKWGTKATLTVQITNVDVTIKSIKYSSKQTLYFKPGTVINIILTPQDDALGDGSIAGGTEGAKIQGATWTGSHTTREGIYSFTMPTNEVTVTFKGESGGGCLIEGTLVWMADGSQKKVEDLKPGDLVIVFNHETGQYEVAPVLYNVHSGSVVEKVMVIRLKFSDGTTIGVTYKHFFYDLDLNCYVLIDEENAHEFIGHRFAKVSCETGKYETVGITLTDVTITEEAMRYYSPVSVYHTNLVTDGLLTHTTWPVLENPEGFMNYFAYDENMKYDEEAMLADIAQYGLYTYEDFEGVLSEEAFYAGPWKYFKVAVGKGQLSWEDILNAIDWLYNSDDLEAL